MKADLYIQDGQIFVFPRIDPLAWDASSFRGNVYSRYNVFISSGPSSSNVMKNSPFFLVSLRNQRRSVVWSISIVQEVLRISARILATSFPVHPRQSREIVLALRNSVGTTNDSKFSCNCSVDTELIDRNNNVKNQNSMVLNGFHFFSLAFSILLFPRHCWHEIQDVCFQQS